MDEPELPRKRNAPRRFEVGTGESSFSTTPEDLYRQKYMEAIDLVVNFIRNHFDQLYVRYKIYCTLENLLLKAAKAEDYTAEIKFVLGFMGVTLTFFFLLNLNFLLVFLMVSIVISLTKAHMCNFSTEVFNIPKVLMVMPATNAVSERSASALRRVKTY